MQFQSEFPSQNDISSRDINVFKSQQYLPKIFHLKLFTDLIFRFVLSHLEVVDCGVSVVVLGEERVERAQLPSEEGGKGDHNWVAAASGGRGGDVNSTMHCVGLRSVTELPKRMQSV